MELKDIKTFVLHGIGYRVYTRGQVVNSTLDPAVYGLAENVEHLNFEKIFDRNASPVEKFIGKNKKMDALLDVYDYYRDKVAITEARALVRHKIQQAREDGFKKIVVIAHSLGSLIGMTCGVPGEKLLIDDFYCLGSPIGFSQTILPNYSIAAFVRREVKKHIKNIVVNNFVVGYSKYDPVCDRYVKPMYKLLKKAGQFIKAYESSTDHDFGFYIEDLAQTIRDNTFHTDYRNPNHRWFWFVPFLGSKRKKHNK